MAELYRNLTFGPLGVSPSAPSVGSIAESPPAVFGWNGAAAWAHSVFSKDERARPPASFELVAGDLSLSAALLAFYCLLSTRAAALFRTIGLLDSRTFATRDVTEASGEDEWRVIDGLDEIAKVGSIEPISGLRHHVVELVRLYARGLSEE